ncbi:MAG: hypothetical protein R3190_08860, partial [Thermoanaerobaculia bacterium]|nr:hypothetical protein [Thermoanaerobaculia bacterium]
AFLDLTQPDPLDTQTVTDPFTGLDELAYIPEHNDSHVPGCSSLLSVQPPGCGILPYPTVMWEYRDHCETGVTIDDETFCDEDSNNEPDLAYSWSKANVGRILVIEPGESDPSIRTVAVVGGGLDPDALNESGNWLYMIDVETGQTLYKRELVGSAPSEPAAVDTDFNGILDTVYIGTTAGFMYKADISSPAQISEVLVAGGVEHKILDPDPTVDTDPWDVFQVFDTLGRPIFFPPQVLFVNSLGTYAIAFGTGDRHDLWSDTYAEQDGRFYMIVDPGFAAGVAPLDSGPLDETVYTQIALGDVNFGLNVDLLQLPLDGNQPGWVLILGADERVVTEALTISGLVSFPTFDPDPVIFCEDFGGNGSIFRVLATNADALASTIGRSTALDGQFAGKPVVSSEGMRRTDADPGDPDDPTDDEPEDPFDDETIQEIRQSLSSLFPDSCRFGNFSVNVSAALSNRGQVPIAQIPVCVAPKNWKEIF